MRGRHRKHSAVASRPRQIIKVSVYKVGANGGMILRCCIAIRPESDKTNCLAVASEASIAHNGPWWRCNFTLLRPKTARLDDFIDFSPSQSSVRRMRQRFFRKSTIYARLKPSLYFIIAREHSHNQSPSVTWKIICFNRTHAYAIALLRLVFSSSSSAKLSPKASWA